MHSIYLKKLTHDDGTDIFEMLKGIDSTENSFTNPTYGMSFQEFREWLQIQEKWAEGKALPEGYVAQTIYWLYDNCVPVGIGKIRHKLTDASMKNGGNIGYAISKEYRGKGYGKKLLQLLMVEAQKLRIEDILLTVDKNNIPSKCVCESIGCVLDHENDERWFFRYYKGGER